MMKDEFELRIGHSVSHEDYQLIEHVYTYHPGIPNITGKDKIAALYKVGGMGLIRAMQPLADEGEVRDTTIQMMCVQIDEWQKEVINLRSVIQSICEEWK